MGELKFQQRWDFRRKEDADLDSSCDGSKSSHGTLLKKHKLVSSLISVDEDDDETSETSRFKQKDNEIPGVGDQSNIAKAKRRKTRNNKSSNLQNDKMKSGTPEEVDLQKGEASANDPAPLDDLKNFMDSLLKDLKVTRGNLLKWMLGEMQKLVADDATVTPEPERRKCGCRGEKVQLQQRRKYRKVHDQPERKHKESMQFQHPNNSEKSILVQHHTNSHENVLQQQNNFQENMKQQVRHQEEENINRQHQNDFKYGMPSQNCNNTSLVRFPEGFISASATAYFNALGDRVDSGQATELITPSKRNKGDSMLISAKQNLQTSSDLSVQVQSPKTVVLAIEAQKGKEGSLKRSAKGKKTVDHSNHYQVPEDQSEHDHATRTAVAGTNSEKLGSSDVQNFLSGSSSHIPCSMYLPLPTVLTEPIFANHGLDASLCNYILPRVAEMKRGMTSERVNQIPEPSLDQRSFPVVQPEERIQSFSFMASRNMGCINQNSTPTSGIGTGFPVPLYEGMMDVGFSIPRQVNPEYPRQVNPQYLSQETSKPLGLRVNGGRSVVSSRFN